jgi:hypothetical protein
VVAAKNERAGAGTQDLRDAPLDGVVHAVRVARAGQVDIALVDQRPRQRDARLAPFVAGRRVQHFANEVGCLGGPAAKGRSGVIRNAQQRDARHFVAARVDFRARFRDRARLAFARFGFARFFGATLSGSSALPVSRFHSSNVSGEISPLTSNSANLRRCALLLNGIESSLRKAPGDLGMRKSCPNAS